MQTLKIEVPLWFATFEVLKRGTLILQIGILIVLTIYSDLDSHRHSKLNASLKILQQNFSKNSGECTTNTYFESGGVLPPKITSD